ncbi:MAG TPA: hypothetical protein VMM17_10575 [Gemmatimonadaceae bacterium]|nr:hypothetical protein [Gemmatimonadaceae bacterium]
MRRLRASTVLAWAALPGVFSACGERDRAALENRAELGSLHGDPVPDTIRTDPDSAVIAASLRLEPGALGSAAAAPVELWKGSGEQPFEVTVRTGEPASNISRRFGTITMRTSLRERAADLGQYPCTSCHLGRRIVMADDRVADAHQNITVSHPVQTGGACSTCHSPENVEQLALKSGEQATLDHTYRLCAQCHFSQAESWAAGAHGKRLDGWQGRRVLMGCADCHDPHKPALEPRIPFRAPQLERPRGRTR